MAKADGREFMTTDPQENYPDNLDVYRQKMKENGWDLGEDDEELFEYAMHPQQYEAFKSGKAKADFEADLAERKAKKNAPKGDAQPKTITVTVNGQSYKVDIVYGDKPAAAPAASAAPAAAAAPAGEGLEVLAPLEGKAYMVSNSSETPKKVGDHVEEGDIICYIEAMKVFNRIKAEKAGTITSINFTSGDSVEEDDVLMTIA
jgi:pyruvate carboxylase subunit B